MCKSCDFPIRSCDFIMLRQSIQLDSAVLLKRPTYILLHIFIMIIFRFHESMKRMTLSSPLRELTTPTMTSSITSLSSSTQSLSPPHTLLDFPPVAQLTNALIHAFNELRQCAPLSLAPSIAQEIKRLLESTVHDIGEYYRYVPSNYTQDSSMHC